MLMTKAAYARHKGVSRQTVYDWIAKGELVLVGGKIDASASEQKETGFVTPAAWCDDRKRVNISPKAALFSQGSDYSEEKNQVIPVSPDEAAAIVGDVTGAVEFTGEPASPGAVIKKYSQWINVETPAGRGWVDVSDLNVKSYSDADMPEWAGWHFVDDDPTQDSQCNSEIVRKHLTSPADLLTHFGLDVSDLNGKGFEDIPGFCSWFILQRYKHYDFKPFVNEANFSVQIEGQ